MKAKIVLFTLIIWGSLVNMLAGQIRSDFVLVPNGVQPHLLLDAQGRLHATWRNRGIYYGLFDSLGNSFQSYLISGSSPSETPRLSISDQFFAVVWTSYSSGFYSHIVGAVVNRENGEVIGEFVNFDGNTATPDISYLTDSTFIAVWAREGPYTPYLVSQIYGQVFTNALDALGDTLWFTDDLPKQSTHFHPRIAKNQAYGNTYVFWISQDTLSSWNVFSRQLTGDGKLQSSSFLISENSNYTKAWGLGAVMDASGNFTVAWSAQVGDTACNVYRRRFNSEGLPMNLCEQINEQPVTPFAEIDMAMDDDGKHILVWEGWQNNKPTIIAQRFATDGTSTGTNFSISVHTDTIGKFAPSVVLENGRIYTTWTVADTIPGRGTIWANILDFNNPTVGIARQPGNSVRSFYLHQNYPNPFNPTTTIRYEIRRRSHVRLVIHNVLGEEIVTLTNKEITPGSYTQQWDGRNKNGIDVPSGIYLYQLIIDEHRLTKKMILFR